MAGQSARAIRHDLEGLRALAILAVLLFHFELGQAVGGFAGVDVFFVISGYLITGMLAGPSGLALHDVKRFAIKRIWRIAPAYYVVTLMTLAGVIFLLPHDRRDAGFAAMATAWFASNFYFTNTAGYFSGFAIHKPFLHTWSLAVEVQFYIAWPLIFMVLRRHSQNVQTGVVVALTAASFILSVILSFSDDKVAFYALPSRLWEFGLGALAALILLRAGDHKWLRFLFAPLTGLVALAVLLVMPWILSDEWIWPAPSALFPALAAMAFILHGHHGGSLASRILSLPVMTGIGRISYSLYLVHWPIAVFSNYFMPPLPSLMWRLAGLILSFALAVLLYRFVEKPARALGRAEAVPMTKSAGLASAPVLASVAALIMATHFGTVRNDQAHGAACARTIIFAGASRCVFGDANAEPDTILWGDSHAQHFAPGFDPVLKNMRRSAVLVSLPTCPPVQNAVRAFNRFRRDARCAAANRAVLDELQKKSGYYDVYLAARWAFYAETTKFGREHAQRVFLVNEKMPALSRDATGEVLWRGLALTVAQASDWAARITLISQVPEMGFDAGQCVRVLRDHDMRCSINSALVDNRMKAMRAGLDDVTRQFPALRLFEPRALLCDRHYCHAQLQGQVAYSDGDHMTRQASAILARAWESDIAR